MSTVGSSQKKEKAKLFEMILSSPGMSENCRISFKMSRQNALLLSRLIETGILSSESIQDDEILGLIPESAKSEFKAIHEEVLKKTGLTDFYEKLKGI